MSLVSGSISCEDELCEKGLTKAVIVCKFTSLVKGRGKKTETEIHIVWCDQGSIKSF